MTFFQISNYEHLRDFLEVQKVCTGVKTTCIKGGSNPDVLTTSQLFAVVHLFVT